MFSLAEFKRVCQLFAVYTASAVTPMEVMTRLRNQNKIGPIVILSDAFEKMPGYSNYLISEFIDLMRLRTLVEDKCNGK
jgi:hypothetical protein